MPPRYAYWTIIPDGTATSFRSAFFAPLPPAGSVDAADAAGIALSGEPARSARNAASSVNRP